MRTPLLALTCAALVAATVPLVGPASAAPPRVAHAGISRSPAPGPGGGADALAADRPALTVESMRDPAAVLRFVRAHAQVGGALTRLASEDVEIVVSGPDHAPRAVMGSMPDVTGDGLDDVLQVSFQPRRLLARNGRTGRVLWSVDASSSYLFSYARLGSPPRPALLAFTMAVGDTGIGSSGATAWDARTGRTLWSASTTALVSEQPGEATFAQLTYPAAVLTQPDGHDDVLLGRLTGSANLLSATFALATAVVDGRTGSERPSGLAMASDSAPDAFGLTDLDGDRVPEVAVAANGTLAQLSVRAGTTGSELWGKVLPGVGGFGSYVSALHGPAGRSTVLWSRFGFDTPGDTLAYDPAGTQRWASDGLVGPPVGDADRDGVADLAWLDPTLPGGFRLAVVSGLTGRKRWSVPVSAGAGTDGGSLSVWLPNDLDGDGISDFLVQSSTAGRHPTNTQKVVSGRGGRVRTYHDLTGVPLGAALSRTGGAVVETEAAGTGVTLTARDLARVLWVARVPHSDADEVWFLDHGHVLPTGTPAVLASLFGQHGTDLVTLDGRTGAVLWRVHV